MTISTEKNKTKAIKTQNWLHKSNVPDRFLSL